MKMTTKFEDFEVLVPNLDGTGVAEKITVSVPLEWDEELQQWLLTPEAHQIIEDTKARHMGLLLPAQFRELRERYGYSQKDMGELFQVGEKSWTRWETGKHRPSRSINLLISALYDGELDINYFLRRAGKLAHKDLHSRFLFKVIKRALESLDSENLYSAGTAKVSKSTPRKPEFAKTSFTRVWSQHADLPQYYTGPVSVLPSNEGRCVSSSRFDGSKMSLAVPSES